MAQHMENDGEACERKVSDKAWEHPTSIKMENLLRHFRHPLSHLEDTLGYDDVLA